MSEDEKVNWLTIAHGRVVDMPAKPFLNACEKVMDSCDHHRFIVPMIKKANPEWVKNLISVRDAKRRLYENANAPRLESQPEPEADPQDRSETANIIRDAVSSLSKAEKAQNQPL